MAIEVRQLTIRSFVSTERENETAQASRQETERMKEQILSECRQMMLELIRADRER
jgi:hypothetical protein